MKHLVLVFFLMTIQLKINAQEKNLLNKSEQQIEKQKKDDEERQNQDWAFLKRYQKENEQLLSEGFKDNRVVFMGNSITEGWKKMDSSFFAKNSYIDRGISGQTTPQMLIRFHPDVINLKPKVVVILAGINDIAENTGRITLENTFENIMAMAEIAKANNVKVILSSVLPANIFPWRPGMEPADKVIRLNEMIKKYVKKEGLIYADYFSAMVDDKKGLKKELTNDGVHPTLAGYKIMEPIVEKAIKEALAK